MRRNLLLFLFLIFIVVFVSLLTFIPRVSVTRYFEGKKLPLDVVGQYAYLKTFLIEPLDDFTGYRSLPQRQWKFQLAFFFYATACMIYWDPGFDPEAPEVLERLLLKYQQKPVWEDWVKDGYGTDPLEKNNMMYRGHLSLMLNLYQAVTGDSSYAGQARRVTLRLYREGLTHPFFGVLCEPDNYYIACNAVAQLSYRIYDKLHGTRLSQVRFPWLKWIREHLRDPETGLLATVYHPSSGKLEWNHPARHNGWDLLFLSAVQPGFADTLYRAYRRRLVRSFAGFAWAVRSPGGLWPDPAGTGFALGASRAEKDSVRFAMFLRSLKRFAKPQWQNRRLRYWRSNLLGNTILLFAKVASFQELFRADFPLLRSRRTASVGQ